MIFITNVQQSSHDCVCVIDSAMYTCAFAVITFLESRAPRSLNQKFEMDFSRLLSVTGRVCFLFGKLYTSLKSKQA